MMSERTPSARSSHQTLSRPDAASSAVAVSIMSVVCVIVHPPRAVATLPTVRVTLVDRPMPTGYGEDLRYCCERAVALGSEARRDRPLGPGVLGAPLGRPRGRVRAASGRASHRALRRSGDRGLPRATSARRRVLRAHAAPRHLDGEPPPRDLPV